MRVRIPAVRLKIVGLQGHLVQVRPIVSLPCERCGRTAPHNEYQSSAIPPSRFFLM
jgi:hypothetical protein